MMLLIAASPVKLFAQALSINYGGPQMYSPNTKITPLAPKSGGVAAPAYGTTLTTINTGITTPFGVAADAAGNLYVSDVTNAIVKEFPVGGGSPVIIGTGQFSHPEGITVDANGNVFAAGDYDAMVTEILKADGSKVSLGSGFNEFSGVAVDATGNVYVADYSSNNSLKEILKSNGTTVPLGSGLSDYVNAVALDAAGNVYVTDGNSGIMEVLASNGSTVSFGTGVTDPQGIAVDPMGDVFVTDQGAIKEIPAGATAAITLVSGLTNPGQIAVDGKGNVFFVDTTNGTVQEISPVGGYYISIPLPTGLAFSGTTGVISGTTPAASAPANYTITAYNSTTSASAIVNITVGTPSAPTLAYQGPKTFTTGLSINQVAPTSTGVGAPGYNSTFVSAGTGYNQNISVATDAAGNVYVADKYNTSIKELPAGGGSQISIPTGYTGPGFYGIAIDAAGNFYLSDQGNNAVFKLPKGGSLQQIGTGFNAPSGLAVDAAGNVYVADHGSNTFKEILASNGSTNIIASGLGNGYSVALDAAGNIYVAATFNNAVKEIPAGGGTPVSIGTGFSTPEGVAVDAVGNVYVSDFDSKSVKLISAATGSTTTIATGFTSNAGLAIDGAGNVYVADPGTGFVDKITPNGGYYINTALPTGLSFNGVTGVISGTPTVVSPSTTYTVTAYNVGGSAQAPINLTIVAPTTINSITLASATITNGYYAQYNVVFGAAVTGLLPSNFSVITTGGLSSATVNYIGGSGTTYSVGVFTGGGEGTIKLAMTNSNGVEPGISTTLPFIGPGFTVDRTAPTATTTSFTSNNANNQVAIAGNTVTLAFTASEAIQTPTITIAGHTVTPVNTSGNSWTASYTMTASDQAGLIAFSVLLTDLAGNTTTVTSASTSSTLTFDSTVPSITGSSFTSDNTFNNKEARVGSIVTLAFTTSEAIKTPKVGIAGHNATATNTSSDMIHWSASYTMRSSDTEGLLDFTVSFSSIDGIAANGGAPYDVANTSSTAVVFDKTAPTVTSITLESPVSSPTGASYLTYEVTFSEAVTNVSPSSFQLTTTGASTGTVLLTSAGLTPNIVNVSVDNVTGPGTVRLDIKTPPSGIVDLAGNTLTAGFTGGQVYTIYAMPTAVTSAATAVTSTGATLNGSANDNDASTLVNFVYGTDPNLASGTTATPATTGGNISAGAGQTNTALTVAGLQASTTYYYRVSAANAAGTGLGKILSFTTPASIVVTAVAPTIQASNITFSNITISSTGISWTNGNGNARAVFVLLSSSGNVVPANSTTYTANSTYGLGSTTSNGWYCVYNGTGTTATLTGLNQATNYRVAVVEYNGSGGGEQYLSTIHSVGNVETLQEYPTVQASNIIFSGTTGTSTTASWTNGNGTARIVFVLKTASGTALPVDNTGYTANSKYGSGTPSSNGWYCVYNGTGSSTPITGLTEGTAYRVTVIEYKGTAATSSQKYLNTINSAADVTTIQTIPSLPPMYLSFSGTTNTTTNASWQNGNGNARVAFIHLGSTGSPAPVNNTTYGAKASYAIGSQIGSTGWYCIYNGSGSGVTIAGLAANTTYRVSVVEYDGTPGSEQYFETEEADGNVTTTLLAPSNNLYLSQENTESPLIASLSNEKVEANNILSPNGDGINDIWVVKNIALYPNNQVSVYDRSGRIVFTRKNYQNDWAGTYNGSVLNEGTYYYLVELGNGSAVKGFITVVRDR